MTNPRTISEIKRLQNFVKSQGVEGKSLKQSIRNLAQKDESFNEFLKNFKSKNEQGWANVIDLTQDQQENKLLEVTPEMRKNQMIMLEEFRRRKNLENYFDLMTDKQREEAVAKNDNSKLPVDMSEKTLKNINEF